jgi:putative component of toxin-antitoxin plasmid stabilization module
MPRTEVIFYRDDDDRVPVLEWIDNLRRPILIDKAKARIDLLEQQGHELRRPHAAPLRDKIHELRWKVGKVNYRVLYFFHGQMAVVLAHGCTKESEVGATDIDRAIHRRARFLADPAGHTYSENEP